MSVSEQTSPQEQNYHPVVEEVMVTSGPNIGRIQDPAVALDLAHIEAYMRADGMPQEAVESNVDSLNQGLIAKRAIGKSALGNFLSLQARGLYNKSSDEGFIKYIPEAKQDASEAVASYKELKKRLAG